MAHYAQGELTLLDGVGPFYRYQSEVLTAAGSHEIYAPSLVGSLIAPH